MKLIIDISEEDYIKAKTGILGSLGVIIAKGIPYEERSQGDSISREALRKNMEFICMGIMAGTEPYNAPLTEIDNAPTVKPCENCDLYFKAMTKEEMNKGGTEND